MLVAFAEVRCDNYIVTNAPMVTTGLYGRVFFKGTMPNELLSNVPRDVFKVVSIDSYNGVVRIGLQFPDGRFTVERRNKDIICFSGNDSFDLHVDEVLRLHMVYSEKRNTYIEVLGLRGFELKLLNVDHDFKVYDSTPLLDELLLMTSTARRAPVSTQPTWNDHKKKYIVKMEAVKKHIRSGDTDPLWDGEAFTVEGLAMFRDLIRSVPALKSSNYPPMAALMDRVRILRRTSIGAKEKPFVWMEGNVGNNALFSSGELEIIARHNRQAFKLESDAKSKFAIALQCVIIGSGKPVNSVQAEVIRVNIKADEVLDVGDFIREFPLHHSRSWNTGNVVDFGIIQKDNERILELLEHFHESIKNLALLRSMLDEPIEPRPQQPGETKAFYTVYLRDFRQHVMKPAIRPKIEAEVDKLRIDVLERKAVISEQLAESFALFRVTGAKSSCFVNMNPSSVFEAFDFEPAKIVGYNEVTCEYKLESILDTNRHVWLPLCDYRVRFQAKYMHKDKVVATAFKARSDALTAEYRGKQIRKEMRDVHGPALRLFFKKKNAKNQTTKLQKKRLLGGVAKCSSA